MAKKDRVFDIDRKVVSTTSSPKAVYTNMRHDAMRNRGLSNQHPIDAITDLRAELNTIPHTLLELDDVEHNYIFPYQILEVNDTTTGMEFSERLNWRGNWIAGTYYKQDAVRYNSSLYAANKQTDTQPGSVDWDMLATDGTGSGGNLPPGGSTSQALLKSSDIDYEVAWGSHQNIDGSGVYTHADIDTHIDTVFGNPHDVKYSQLSDTPDLTNYLPVHGHTRGAMEAVQRFTKGIGTPYIDEDYPGDGVTIDGMLIRDHGIPTPKFGVVSVVGQVLVAIDDAGNAAWGDAPGGGKWIDDEYGIHYMDSVGIGIESPYKGLLVNDTIHTKGMLKVEGIAYIGTGYVGDYVMYVGDPGSHSSNIIHFVNGYSSSLKLYEDGLFQINPSSGEAEVVGNLHVTNNIYGKAFLIGTGSDLPYISNDAGHLHISNPDGSTTVGSGKTMHIEGMDNISITSWGLGITLDVSDKNVGGDKSISLQITEYGWYFMNKNDIVLRIDADGQIYSGHMDILPL